MKIGFDAKRLFNNFTGLGNYSRTLVSSLQTNYPDNDYFLFTNKIVETPRTIPFIKSQNYKIVQPKSGNLIWRSYGMLKETAFQELDVYHGLSHEFPLGIKNYNLKKVVTIHDLIFKYYPKDYKYFDRLIYDFKFKTACNDADIIIAISHQTKSDIIQFYNINPDKIRIIYQSCDPIFRKEISSSTIELIQKKYNLPQEYFLYVGSIISRKNLDGIIKALFALPKGLQLPLAIIGEGKLFKKEINSLIHQLNFSHSIIWLKPEFKDFPCIYKRAKALILPSYFEGFGIPILEAMSVGTPVITSNQSSLAEVGGDAAILVDPSNIEQISDAMENLLTNQSLQEQLQTKGIERSKKFDPNLIADQVMKLYQ